MKQNWRRSLVFSALTMRVSACVGSVARKCEATVRSLSGTKGPRWRRTPPPHAHTLSLAQPDLEHQEPDGMTVICVLGQ